jgi:hypothetical protein
LGGAGELRYAGMPPHDDDDDDDVGWWWWLSGEAAGACSRRSRRAHACWRRAFASARACANALVARSSLRRRL